MRIAIFTDTFSPEINGVCNTLARLIEYLESRQIEYLCFAPDYQQDSTPPDTNERIIRIRSFRAPFYENSRIALPSYVRMRELAASFAPDIVHVTTALPIGWCGMKFARECGLPLVMSYHTNFDMYLKYYKLEYLQHGLERYLRWFHNHADLNLAPSTSTRQELILKGYPRVGIWSRGIDAQRFQPLATEYKTDLQKERAAVSFLYVGRLAAEKNLDVLLDAIAQFHRLFPGQATFTFTGDGPYREQIELRQLPNVILTGFKTGAELIDIYAQADCFVCPSASETFGNVMLEAMACGLPVICANRGGQLDFARNYYNALYFQHDCVESLTHAMRHAMQHPNLLHQLSHHARETALERSWTRIFDKLIDDYRSLITVMQEEQLA